MRNVVFVGLVLVVAAVASCGGSPTCSTGCMSASGQCVGGTSSLACGNSGLACSACGPTQQCVVGACVNVTGGTGGGGGSGSLEYTTGPDGGQVVSVATGDSCAGFPSLFTEYTTAIGDCQGPDVSVSPMLLSEAACRARLPSCAADRAQMEVILNCFRRVAPCTRSTSQDWINRTSVCRTLARSLTPACQNAFTAR